MYKGIFYTHLISVILFLLIYVVKTILMLMNNEAGLSKFTKSVKVPEMIVSTLFLLTGIYMLIQIPEVKSLLIIKIIVVFASIPVAVIGFKKRNKALAVLSLVMIIAAYGLAEMSKKQKSASVPDESNVIALPSTPADGHDIFMANCTSCHGENGKLGLTDAADLSASTLDLNTRVEIIKNGKGTMNGFGSILSDAQIKAVAEYTETLKK
jgi:uncharacterized membrane protein SirB2